MNPTACDYKMRDVLERITLGVIKVLEHQVGITDVKMLDRKPAEPDVIFKWEQKNMCKLPAEIKNFYLTTDGLMIHWSVTCQGKVMPLGRMEVNPIASLTNITSSRSTNIDTGPGLADIDDIDDECDSKGRAKPHFDQRNRIFELDNCAGNGKVCLVYKEVKAGFTVCQPEIWFLDRALQWFHLSDNFINYFRMLMIHLGLPCWQYLFTDSGPSPETKRWFNLYAPERLTERLQENENTDFDIVQNKLDSQRVFKSKSEKKKVTPTESTRGKTQPTAAKTKTTSLRQHKNVIRSTPR
eukprot:gene9848-10858_t